MYSLDCYLGRMGDWQNQFGSPLPPSPRHHHQCIGCTKTITPKQKHLYFIRPKVQNVQMCLEKINAINSQCCKCFINLLYNVKISCRARFLLKNCVSYLLIEISIAFIFINIFDSSVSKYQVPRKISFQYTDDVWQPVVKYNSLIFLILAIYTS